MTISQLRDSQREWAGMLTRFALDVLWQCSPDGAPEGEEASAEGCCPRCCAACCALKGLLDAGQLDAWVLAWPDELAGLAWWTDANQVDREWLVRAWAKADFAGCHDDTDEE